MYLQASILKLYSLLNRKGRLLLLEKFPNFSLHRFPGFLAVHFVFRDEGLKIDVSGNEVSGGEDMVVVHKLDERLNLRSPLDLLSAHTLSHPQGVPLNSCHQGVGKFLVL